MSIKYNDVQEYFEKTSGIFTALAVFIALALITDKTIFPSGLYLLAGLYLSILLVSYLFLELTKIKYQGAWVGLIFIGFLILYLALFMNMENKFPDMFKYDSPGVYLMSGFMIYVLGRFIWNSRKR